MTQNADLSARRLASDDPFRIWDLKLSLEGSKPLNPQTLKPHPPSPFGTRKGSLQRTLNPPPASKSVAVW